MTCPPPRHIGVQIQYCPELLPVCYRSVLCSECSGGGHCDSYMSHTWKHEKESMRLECAPFIHSLNKIFCFRILFTYLFLERGKGREGERRTKTLMCGCLSRVPHWGPGLHPRHVPWLGIEPVSLRFRGWSSIHRATPARPQQKLLRAYFVLGPSFAQGGGDSVIETT